MGPFDGFWGTVEAIAVGRLGEPVEDFNVTAKVVAAKAVEVERLMGPVDEFCRIAGAVAFGRPAMPVMI